MSTTITTVTLLRNLNFTISFLVNFLFISSTGENKTTNNHEIKHIIIVAISYCKYDKFFNNTKNAKCELIKIKKHPKCVSEW